jgi:uncharacterized damage-inducible protein DinB
MNTQTISEKDMFLSTWEREFEITRRVIKAYPAGKEDFKPAEKSRTGRELMWDFVLVEKMFDDASQGKVDMMADPSPPPATVAEIIKRYEATHAASAPKVRRMPESLFNTPVQVPTGPGKIGEVRNAEMMWTMLFDSINHRGQLVVYLRILGAKVPSIYGPSADEPW